MATGFRINIKHLTRDEHFRLRNTEKMKNIKIFKHIKTLGLILLITAGGAAGWFIFNQLAIEACLDDGKVWDYAENRCRNDCLKWNENHGCIN